MRVEDFPEGETTLMVATKNSKPKELEGKIIEKNGKKYFKPSKGKRCFSPKTIALKKNTDSIMYECIIFNISEDIYLKDIEARINDLNGKLKRKETNRRETKDSITIDIKRLEKARADRISMLEEFFRQVISNHAPWARIVKTDSSFKIELNRKKSRKNLNTVINLIKAFSNKRALSNVMELIYN